MLLKGLILGAAIVLLLNNSVSAEGELISRIWGNDRYGTAVAVSKKGWQNSDYVIVVRGDDFPDALCACPLAKKYNAPILLIEPERMAESVLDEVKRLKASHVIIVGGFGAVSENVEQELIDAGIDTVERIYGKDRYETSVRVAERMGSYDSIAAVTGSNYPDALSISAIAANLGMPILLINMDGIPDDVGNYLTYKRIVQTYVIGGTGVISEKVSNMLPNVIRIGGADRYETNAEVIKCFKNKINFEVTYIAAGEGYADALTGAVLAAKTLSPIILVHESISTAADELLSDILFSDTVLIAVGGDGVLPDAVLYRLLDCTGSYTDAFSHTTEEEIENDDGDDYVYEKVVSLNAVDSTTLEVGFDREVSCVSKPNFYFDKDMEVKSAAVKAGDRKTVMLTTSIQKINKLYRLYYRGANTGKEFLGLPSISLTYIDKPYTGKQGKTAAFEFDVKTVSGLAALDNVIFLLEWTRGGLPALSSDLSVVYKNSTISEISGVYQVGAPHTIQSDEHHVLYITFNNEGTYMLTIFAQTVDDK